MPYVHVHRRRVPVITAAIGCVLGLVQLALAANRSDTGSTEPACHVDGIAEAIRCFVVQVPENRESAETRTISIHVSVVPALVRDKAPDPFLVFAGGPGQGARSYGPLVTAAFNAVRRTRDIVLVDLRGTGDSAPLNCGREASSLEAALPLDGRSLATGCLAELEADPRLYTHDNALADLAEVLEHLGVRRVNLWGGSWGTRSALLFAARFPALVRSVVLDGAVAMDLLFPWSFPTDADRALRLYADACAIDAACREQFPDAYDGVAGWLRSVEERPLHARVRHPRSAREMDVVVTARVAAEILRGALYVPGDAATIFAVVREARAGNLGPLLAQAERTFGWATRTMALGQTFSILCSEDVGRALRPTDALPEAYWEGAPEYWQQACDVWPKGPGLPVDADVSLPTPALILSGQLDPVTPPRRGDAMRHHFPDSLHLVVPAGAHNVSAMGCVPELITEFVSAGDWRGLDTRCVGDLKLPAFASAMGGERP